MNQEETKSSNSKAKTAVIFILILIITAVICFFILKSKDKKGANPWANMPKQEVIYSVKTQLGEPVTITDFVVTSGDVQTQSSIEVFPSIGGKIVQMNVTLGSPVKKGDVIAKIDASEAGSYYTQSPVIAPISGSILSSPAKLGAKVSANSVITTIGDIENLQITTRIPERYVGELAIGQKAEISLEAYPNVIFMATVSRISPVLDAATRTKEVILNFDEKDKESFMQKDIKKRTDNIRNQMVVKDLMKLKGATETYLKKNKAPIIINHTGRIEFEVDD